MSQCVSCTGYKALNTSIRSRNPRLLWFGCVFFPPVPVSSHAYEPIGAVGRSAASPDPVAADFQVPKHIQISSRDQSKQTGKSALARPAPRDPFDHIFLVISCSSPPALIAVLVSLGGAALRRSVKHPFKSDSALLERSCTTTCSTAASVRVRGPPRRSAEREGERGGEGKLSEIQESPRRDG